MYCLSVGDGWGWVGVALCRDRQETLCLSDSYFFPSLGELPLPLPLLLDSIIAPTSAARTGTRYLPCGLLRPNHSTCDESGRALEDTLQCKNTQRRPFDRPPCVSHSSDSRIAKEDRVLASQGWFDSFGPMDPSSTSWSAVPVPSTGSGTEVEVEVEVVDEGDVEASLAGSSRINETEPEPEPNPRKRKTRLRTTCQACQRTKSKCIKGEGPACLRCSKRGEACEWDPIQLPSKLDTSVVRKIEHFEKRLAEVGFGAGRSVKGYPRLYPLRPTGLNTSVSFTSTLPPSRTPPPPSSKHVSQGSSPRLQRLRLRIAQSRREHFIHQMRRLHLRLLLPSMQKLL